MHAGFGALRWHRRCSLRPRAERGHTRRGHGPPPRRRPEGVLLLPNLRVPVAGRDRRCPAVAGSARRPLDDSSSGRCRAHRGRSGPSWGSSGRPLRSSRGGRSDGARLALTQPHKAAPDVARIDVRRGP